MLSDAVSVRIAELSDYTSAAELRWRWLAEEDVGTPQVPRAEFLECFVAWAIASYKRAGFVESFRLLQRP